MVLCALWEDIKLYLMLMAWIRALKENVGGKASQLRLAHGMDKGVRHIVVGHAPQPHSYCGDKGIGTTVG